MTETLIQELAKQGPLICALVLAIYYFYNRQNKQEELYAKQAEKVEKFLTEDRMKMIQIIENNTAVMKDNAASLKENTEVLKTLEIIKNKN
jgi:hypothetical protein